MDEHELTFLRNEFDQRYVKKDDCVDNRTKVDNRIDETEKSFAVLNTKLNWLIGILSTIGVSVLGIAINGLLGG